MFSLHGGKGSVALGKRVAEGKSERVSDRGDGKEHRKPA